MAVEIPLGQLSLDTIAVVRALEAVQDKLQGTHQSAVRTADQMERIGDAFRQLGDGLASFSPSLRDTVSLFGDLASGNIAGVVGDVGRLGERFVETAIDAERHARALAALGPAYDLVRASTNDAVSAEQAWQAQQRLTQSGMRVSAEQLADITRSAREYARATGTDTEAALERLTGALISGRERGLRPFHIELAHGASRSEAYVSSLQQMHEHNLAAAPSARTLAEEVARTSREFHDMTSAMVGSAAQMLHLQDIFHGFTDYLTGSATQRQTALMVGTIQDQTRSELYRQIRQRIDANPTIGGARQLGNLNDVGTEDLAQLRNLLDQAQVAATNGNGAAGNAAIDEFMTGVSARTRTAAEANATDKEPASTRTPHAHAGHSQEAQRERADFRLLREAIDDARGAFRQWTDQIGNGTPIREQLHFQLDRIRDDWNNLVSSGERAAREAERDADALNGAHAKLSTAQADAARGQDNFGQEIGAHFKDLSDQMGTHASLAQQNAALVNEAFDSMTASFKSHLGAVIQGKESLGQALRSMLEETLLNLAVESTVKALFNLAEGIAAAASENYAGAAKFFAASAEYAAVAVLAGAGAGAMYSADKGSSGGGGGFQGGGTRSNMGGSTGGGGGGSGGGPTYVISINGALMNEGVEHGVIRALDSASMRGQWPRATRNLRDGRGG